MLDPNLKEKITASFQTASLLVSDLRYLANESNKSDDRALHLVATGLLDDAIKITHKLAALI